MFCLMINLLSCKTCNEKKNQNYNLFQKRKKLQPRQNFFVTDSIIEQILFSTKSNKIDLIVMGSHGRTGIDKLILGSIANGIVQ